MLKKQHVATCWALVTNMLDTGLHRYGGGKDQGQDACIKDVEKYIFPDAHLLPHK
jgi:hypothetical protein